MEEIQKMLKERGSKYGSFEENSRLTQSLMEIVDRQKILPYAHREALHMIFHKISRMVCGDSYYEDNIVDIIGYAELLLKVVREKNKKI